MKVASVFTTPADLIAEEKFALDALNADYDARATVSDDFAAEMQAYRAASDEARRNCLSYPDVCYDPVSAQKLDIYGAGILAAPRAVFIFIHGGYWRALAKEDSAMMAQMLARQNIATVVIDYPLAPQASLETIVHHVRLALRFIWREAAAFCLDRKDIHIGGSSAGGHLAAMCLARGWHEKYQVPKDIVKSALSVSGLFELAPLAKTFPQQWLQLRKEDVEALSPIRHLPHEGCPLTVAWAEHDADGFKRQSHAFSNVWSKIGPVKTLEVEERNHFNLLMDLANEETELSQALLQMIKAPAR